MEAPSGTVNWLISSSCCGKVLWVADYVCNGLILKHISYEGMNDLGALTSCSVLLFSPLKPLVLKRCARINTNGAIKLFTLSLCWTVVLFFLHGRFWNMAFLNNLWFGKGFISKHSVFILDSEINAFFTSVEKKLCIYCTALISWNVELLAFDAENRRNVFVHGTFLFYFYESKCKKNIFVSKDTGVGYLFSIC